MKQKFMDWQKKTNKQCRRRRTKAARGRKRREVKFCGLFSRENDDQSRPGRLDQRLKNLVQGYNEDNM